LQTPVFFGIFGILENSAFQYSVEKGRPTGKKSGFEDEKRVFCVFLDFRPIFGGLLIMSGGKNGDF